MNYLKASPIKDYSTNTKMEILYHLPNPYTRSVELARAIIFPGYFGNSTVNSHTINYHIGVNVETLFGLLTEQILAGALLRTGKQ